MSEDNKTTAYEARKDITCLYHRSRLKNKDFSVISNDCSATYIYTDLGMKKLSPTCGLTVEYDLFTTFCRHLREYLSLPVDTPTEEELKKYPGCTAPIGILHGKNGLPDIGLIFTHYPSLEDAREKWYRRRERVNYDNLYFIMCCGRDKDESIQDDFESLPYENKIMLTQLEDPDRWKDTLRLRCYDSGIDPWLDMPDIGRRVFTFRWFDEFDYVSWLNGEPKSKLKRKMFTKNGRYVFKEKRDDDVYLTLVNTSYPMDFSMLEKINLQEYSDMPGCECKVEEKTLEQYKKLRDYVSQYGITMGMSSAYRSYAEQKKLFEEAENERDNNVRRVSSPGKSEHHTGLAIDISIDNNEKEDDIEYMHRAYSIIHVACPYFGFIVRYPRNKRYVTGFRYKPLHLRYVGEKAATYISKNKLTLEEYFL